ncbi:MAG: hypothetical protein RQ867_05520 [Mariprofundaceae bacterium]|nr:hypothetical protein [Mariprofundaceae bacterium]
MTTNGMKNWQVPWVACSNCTEQSINDPSGNPKKHVLVVGPKIRRITSLVEEKSPMVDIIETLFSLAECVSHDFSHYSQCNYHLLRTWGADPLDYLTSNTTTHFIYGRPVDGLSKDQALACAWDIMHQTPHVLTEMSSRYGLYGVHTVNIIRRYLNSCYSLVGP